MLNKVAMLHNTNQPQISRQMNELEAQCGGRLFNRTGRGV
ncbi:LysR family transcriptional regulator [Acinetobacter baumannii]